MGLSQTGSLKNDISLTLILQAVIIADILKGEG